MPRRKKKYTDSPVVPAAPAAMPTVVAEYLGVKQVAVYLSATPTSSRRWLKSQKLQCVKIGRRFTYRRSDIDAAWAHKAAA